MTLTQQRLRAAVIGALLGDPSSRLWQECRADGLIRTWERFVTDDASLPPAMRRNFRAIDPEELLQRAANVDAQLLLPTDAAWPGQLAALDSAEPWALWVRGPGLHHLGARRAVSIVGARACTDYGRRVASELAAGIAENGNPVVSGGAFGIDAAVHRGALAVSGVTVAVLASGVDVAYPAEHAALLDRIADTGLVVSEALPGSGVTKPAFLVRNRLIAALGYGTVVVEARNRSGSISTYAHARALQRVLMAVPGAVTSPESAGCHRLLQEDALLVTSAQDVLACTEPLGSVPLAEPEPSASEWDTLGLDERVVHELLPARRGIAVDALLERCNLTSAQLLGALAMLAARGIIEERVDGTWIRKRSLRGAVA